MKVIERQVSVGERQVVLGVWTVMGDWKSDDRRTRRCHEHYGITVIWVYLSY